MTQPTLTTLSLKIYGESKDLFNRLKEESEAPTADAFLNLLLENFENPRKVLHRNEDLKQIAELKIEINDLKAENERLQELKNTTLSSQEVYENKISELEAELLNLKSDDKIIFSLSDDANKIIDGKIEHYKKQGKGISRSKMFYFLIKSGDLSI